MKKKTIIAGATIVTLLGLMTWTLAANKKVIDTRKEVKTTESDVAVTVATAQMQETNGDLELVGTAQPSKEVNVASEISGKIVRVNFKMGDFVNQGKVLAQIDDTYKRLAYDNAKLTYNKCKEDLNRYEALRKGDAVSDTQLRDIRLAYENANIQLENAKKQWEEMGCPTYPTPAQVKELKEASELKTEELPVKVEGEEVVLEFELPVYGVALIKLM